MSDGTARCWGYNGGGQLGDGTTTTRLLPVVVKNSDGTGTLTGMTAIALGNLHTCAWMNDGTARCWGSNGNGVLGDGTSTTRLLPVVVKNSAGTGALTGINQVTPGGSQTCAVMNLTSAVCWGTNANGQLGDGTTTTRLLPVVVKNPAGSGALDRRHPDLGTRRAHVRVDDPRHRPLLGQQRRRKARRRHDDQPAAARDGSDPVAGGSTSGSVCGAHWNRTTQLRSRSSRTEDMQAAEVGEDALLPYVPRLLRAWPAGSRIVAVEGTLVSADLSGFTALSEKLAALGREGGEELTTLLTESLHRHDRDRRAARRRRAEVRRRRAPDPLPGRRARDSRVRQHPGDALAHRAAAVHERRAARAPAHLAGHALRHVSSASSSTATIVS